MIGSFLQHASTWCLNTRTSATSRVAPVR